MFGQKGKTQKKKKIKNVKKCAKCGLRRNAESCAQHWQRQQEKRQAQYMDDAQTLFSQNDADGCREMKCQRVS